MTDEIIKYRFGILSQVPRWLKGTIGAKILYAIGLFLDDQMDRTDQAIKFSYPYPGSGPGMALPLIGRARKIVRGLAEFDDSYAVRLTHWLFARKRQGGIFALMEQLQAYLQAPAGEWGLTVRVIDDSGNRYTLAPGGFLYADDYTAAPVCPVSIDTVSWNWDGTTNPNRFWVVLCATTGTLWSRDGTWADSGLWNDLNTSDGTLGGTPLDPLARGDVQPTYGSTASYSTVQGILGLVRDWTPPHATCAGVILAFDVSEFDSITPDGTWNLPGNRDPRFVYWDL